MNDVTRVSFGPTSIIIYLGALAAAIPPIIHGVEEGSSAAVTSGGNKWLVIATIAFTTAATVVRGFQAGMKAHRAIVPNPELSDPLPPGSAAE